MSWLDTILQENREFTETIRLDDLPTERQPCPYAVVTCMDPRVNLAAVGVLPFETMGGIQSQVRVIRTLGGMADERSLAVGIHLAGFREIAVIMHTDCGCSVAYEKVDTLIENMQANLTPTKWEELKARVGEPLREGLIAWLHAFEDPREAVKKQVQAIHDCVVASQDLIVHGLVYDLSSGAVEIVVDGYGS